MDAGRLSPSAYFMGVGGGGGYWKRDNYWWEEGDESLFKIPPLLNEFAKKLLEGVDQPLPYLDG